ncbi:tetratricopeptide repeat protein [Prevotella sp. KH2C16]|uniref:tetratricopeptide repeat protein n=1 Tax=Prevotella sp. KH2C16 TaxID=1855325 RepID=UPI0008F247D2|nr:tetratricopeptide repeat protein [Prevotella sp. KH2C16]SFF99512.1 Ca-activated chloride channel family protein [Prevotella sp. KH2C16]
MKFLRYIVLSFACMAALSVNAQSDRAFVRQGNRLYRQQAFDKAEVEYRKALSKNTSNPQALYNLGCALMMQNKDSAAIVQYENAAKIEQGKIRKAKIYHNMGVICQRHQMFAEAIKAYEESLRNNPADDETRYNLALCKRQQKQQQQEGGGQSNKNDKNKDKKKQQKQQQEKQEQSSKQQSPKEQMSKENAEQLLNAAMQEEKATQQRMKEKMRQPQKRQLQKNW